MYIHEIVIVEGKYDKIKLASFLDGVIVPTDGFSLFKNKEKMALIRTYAKTRGIVVLTDSDSAGFLIRGYLKKCVPMQCIKHAYIPELKGKEKRKALPGKEGLLGVEGMTVEVLHNALVKAGCHIDNETPPPLSLITKTDLYNDGLLGKPDSAKKRKQLLSYLQLPSKLSANGLLDALNSFVGYDEYRRILENL